MTRTERNQNPAALLKDKHSRSGIDRPHEMDRKQKAGMHKAEEVRREGEYERNANEDVDGEGVFEMEEDVAELPKKGRTSSGGGGGGDLTGNGNGDKEAQDVTGTSPADSTASIDSAKARPTTGARRMSNASPEEIAQARSYREGVMSGGGPVNLANIARTSFGVASPPNGNGFAGLAGTSPTKYKNTAQA